MKIKFEGCEHLDFLPNYGNCKRQEIAGGGLFWMRDVDPSMPSMVQFCKKRGRLNFPEACLKKGECSDYKKIEHCVDVGLDELEK